MFSESQPSEDIYERHIRKLCYFNDWKVKFHQTLRIFLFSLSAPFLIPPYLFPWTQIHCAQIIYLKLCTKGRRCVLKWNVLIAHHVLGSDKVPACSPESLIERIWTTSGRIFLGKDIPITHAPTCFQQQHAEVVDTGIAGRMQLVLTSELVKEMFIFFPACVTFF